MTANIMSLGGLAVAIGALVDASVVMVEQTHKKLEHWEAEGRPGPSHAVVIAAVKEVGGPSFFALLVIAVGFLPVFTLEGQRGASLQTARIHQEFFHGDCCIAGDYAGSGQQCAFSSRAWTVSTSVPSGLRRSSMRSSLARSTAKKITPISKPMMKVYHPWSNLFSTTNGLTICGALLIMALSVPSISSSDRSSCRRSTKAPCSTCRRHCPGISVAEATRTLITQEPKSLASFRK